MSFVVCQTDFTDCFTTQLNCIVTRVKLLNTQTSTTGSQQQLINDKFNEKYNIHIMQFKEGFTVQLTIINREHGNEGENGG